MSARNKKVILQGNTHLTLTTIDRHLRHEPTNTPFSIISDIEFSEAKKALNSLLKSLRKSGEIRPMIHKPALTYEAVVKVYEATNT